MCTASPISRATASARAISASVQVVGLRAVEPEDRRSCGRTRGSASRAQRAVPRSIRVWISPSVGSSSAGSARTSPLGDRAPLASREVRDGKPLGRGADRNEAVGIPLRTDRHRVPAGSPSRMKHRDDADSLARLLDGDPEDGLEVELRAHLPADRSHEPLSLERILERGRRARPLEGERRLGGKAWSRVVSATRRRAACGSWPRRAPPGHARRR